MTCPICDKDTDPKYRPFCSRRCADVDLGRWLKGSYAIPGEDLEDVDAETPEDATPENRKPH
jgi:endogenous inhibitor of DNA gyrase (YacG/DUF329 family)